MALSNTPRTSSIPPSTASTSRPAWRALIHAMRSAIGLTSQSVRRAPRRSGAAEIKAAAGTGAYVNQPAYALDAEQLAPHEIGKAVGFRTKENGFRIHARVSRMDDQTVVDPRHADAALQQSAVSLEQVCTFQKVDDLPGQEIWHEGAAPTEDIAQAPRDGLVRSRHHACVRRIGNGDKAVAAAVEDRKKLKERRLRMV